MADNPEIDANVVINKLRSRLSEATYTIVTLEAYIEANMSDSEEKTAESFNQ